MPNKYCKLQNGDKLHFAKFAALFTVEDGNYKSPTSELEIVSKALADNNSSDETEILDVTTCSEPPKQSNVIKENIRETQKSFPCAKVTPKTLAEKFMARNEISNSVTIRRKSKSTSTKNEKVFASTIVTRSKSKGTSPIEKEKTLEKSITINGTLDKTPEPERSIAIQRKRKNILTNGKESFVCARVTQSKSVGALLIEEEETLEKSRTKDGTPEETLEPEQSVPIKRKRENNLPRRHGNFSCARESRSKSSDVVPLIEQEKDRESIIKNKLDTPKKQKIYFGNLRELESTLSRCNNKMLEKNPRIIPVGILNMKRGGGELPIIQTPKKLMINGKDADTPRRSLWRLSESEVLNLSRLKLLWRLSDGFSKKPIVGEQTSLTRNKVRIFLSPNVREKSDFALLLRLGNCSC